MMVRWRPDGTAPPSWPERAEPGSPDAESNVATESDVAGDDIPVRQEIEVPENPRPEEHELGGEGPAALEVSEAVTPVRRFYPNPADL